MWAVVEINKKQYLVNKGETLEVQRLEVELGEVIFNNVLLIVDEDNVKVGTPYLSGAKVSAEVKGEKKADKVLSYKYRRRKKSRRIRGHRQIYSIIKINDILS